MTRKIQQRLLQLQAARSLADLGPPYQGPARCHELKGDRAGQLSVDLKHPYRLCCSRRTITPYHNDQKAAWIGRK